MIHCRYSSLSLLMFDLRTIVVLKHDATFHLVHVLSCIRALLRYLRHAFNLTLAFQFTFNKLFIWYMFSAASVPYSGDYSP